MIESDKQLDQCIEQLDHMYRVLAELRSRVLPVSQERFQLMAEGPVDEIRRLQSEIESYLDMELVERTA
jgi:hypothetical protein